MEISFYLFFRQYFFSYFRIMKKKYYLFNPGTLSYDRVTFFKYFREKLLYIFAILLVFFIVGLYVGNKITDRKHYLAEQEMIQATKHDFVIGGPMWRDSVMTDYTKKTDLYLSQYEGTPLSGELLMLCAMNAYDSTGILLPVELALSQAQWESGMGLKGKSPTRNPYNIGEHDSGTVQWFETTFDGVQAYYYFMCNNYLKCSDLKDLVNNFVNCSGKRYASSRDYETHVGPTYYYIKKWLEKKLKNKVSTKQRYITHNENNN